MLIKSSTKLVDDSKMLYKADNLWSKSVQLGVTSPNKIKHSRGTERIGGGGVRLAHVGYV